MSVALVSFVFLLSFLGNNILVECTRTARTYEPNWKSLDSRPLPAWYDKAKVGIFLHWGIYSVPSFESEWFWKFWHDGEPRYPPFMDKSYVKGTTYQDLARDFTAEFFDPEEWAALFKKAGAKYVVLTSKHHEGFTLWPSNYSYSWNSVDVGPHIDIVGNLSAAVRNAGLTFGLYHSLLEWYNPQYVNDKASNFVQTNFVNNKVMPELKGLIENYKPDLLWSDGEWEASDDYWQSTKFLAWLYNESPVKDTIVVNDRWGKDALCTHGDFYTCNDRYNPGVLQKHKWENAMTVDKKSWGYRRNIKLEELLTMQELIETLVLTISCGGNILINIGPTKEGVIAPIFQKTLLDLGHWLDVNGEAIYESKPWKFQNDTISGSTWYTSKGKAVYAINLKWPSDDTLAIGAVKGLFKTTRTVTMLGYDGTLDYEIDGNMVNIDLPEKSKVDSNWAWVIKIT